MSLLDLIGLGPKPKAGPIAAIPHAPTTPTTVTQGISKKLIADLIVSVVTFALTAFAAKIPPGIAFFISKGLGFAIGAWVGPNATTVKP